MDFKQIEINAGGQRITIKNNRLDVPDNPVIPFIEGDGIGPDIWRAAQRVIDAAVEKTYGGGKKIAWTEILAGEKAYRATGEWLPQDTLAGARAGKTQRGHIPREHRGCLCRHRVAA